MNNVDFKEANSVMEAGDNPETVDLPIAFSVTPSGFPSLVSCFEITDEEIEELKKTKKLYIAIRGWGMPPIAPLAFNPFDTYGYTIYSKGKVSEILKRQRQKNEPGSEG